MDKRARTALNPEITPPLPPAAAPAWAITFAGAVVRLSLTCQRCGGPRLTIASTVPVMGRTFLKSYFRDGAAPALPADVTILCPDCEAPNVGQDEVPKL
jgi:hypothetical protein